MSKTKPKNKNSKQTSKKPKVFKRGMQNKRYRRTEEAIIEVLLKSKNIPGVSELTKRARISRSTLYRHHRAIPGIVPDYERDILRVYGTNLRKLSKNKEMDLKNAYFAMLIFVMRHQRVFNILFRFSGDRVVEEMVLKLKVEIADRCHLPKGSYRMVWIYAKEVAGIVEDWGERGFLESEISKTLSDIMYLTKTMRMRLGPVG